MDANAHEAWYSTVAVVNVFHICARWENLSLQMKQPISVAASSSVANLQQHIIQQISTQINLLSSSREVMWLPVRLVITVWHCRQNQSTVTTVEFTIIREKISAKDVNWTGNTTGMCIVFLFFFFTAAYSMLTLCLVLRSFHSDKHINNEEIPKEHDGMEHSSDPAHLLCNLNLSFQEKCS